MAQNEEDMMTKIKKCCTTLRFTERYYNKLKDKLQIKLLKFDMFNDNKKKRKVGEACGYCELHDIHDMIKVEEGLVRKRLKHILTKKNKNLVNGISYFSQFVNGSILQQSDETILTRSRLRNMGVRNYVKKAADDVSDENDERGDDDQTPHKTNMLDVVKLNAAVVEQLKTVLKQTSLPDQRTQESVRKLRNALLAILGGADMSTSEYATLLGIYYDTAKYRYYYYRYYCYL